MGGCGVSVYMVWVGMVLVCTWCGWLRMACFTDLSFEKSRNGAVSQRHDKMSKAKRGEWLPEHRISAQQYQRSSLI